MFSSKLRLAGLVAGTLALSASTGFAQTAAPKPSAKPAAPTPAQAPAPAPAAQPPAPGNVLMIGFGDWIKLCGRDDNAKKDICFVKHDFGETKEEGPLMTMAVYEVKGEKERVIRMQLPLGFLIKPGMKFTFDKGAELSGTFDFCLPNGCFIESKVDGNSFESMRKASKMNISVQNMGGNQVNFAVPLDGMAKSLDGPVTDTKALEDQQRQQQEQQRLAQEKLQQELAKKAEEERKKLEGAGGAAAPAVPPK